MNRHEGREIFVRYDGTETRVDIHRGAEFDDLSVDELEQFIDTLEDALRERLEFITTSAKLRKKMRRAVKEKKR